MPVGPFARFRFGCAQGHDFARRISDEALARASSVAGQNLTPAVLHSTLGRHLARAARAGVIAEAGVKQSRGTYRGAPAKRRP